MQVQIQSTQTGKIAFGEIVIQTWGPQKRLKKAAQVWAASWGLAVFSVLIPFLHFFLVPSFLVGGPLIATWFYRRESAITGGTGICPECQKTFQIAKGSNRFPLSDVCEYCHKGLEITPATNAAFAEAPSQFPFST